MDRDEFERAIAWGRAYDPCWDDEPDAYVTAGRVAWGRTRRLGKLALPAGFKAYLGVQHVDPAGARWDVEAPEARFFVSWFDGPRCVSLRTTRTMGAARDLLWAAWRQHAAGHGRSAGAR